MWTFVLSFGSRVRAVVESSRRVLREWRIGIRQSSAFDWTAELLRKWCQKA